jgi:hypothetical protein
MLHAVAPRRAVCEFPESQKQKKQNKIKKGKKGKKLIFVVGSQLSRQKPPVATLARRQCCIAWFPWVRLRARRSAVLQAHQA